MSDLVIVNTTSQPVIVNDTSNIVQVTSPTQSPVVIEVLAGSQGSVGPANVLSIGSVTGSAPGTQPSASITGTAPSQVLNLTLPTGATGPTNSLTIGTVTSGAASATITGAAPSQTLNLVLPPGPSNSLAVGTVTPLATGATPTVTITGASPSQTINFGLPAGPVGPAPSLAIGTVSTGAAGSNAVAAINGTNPNYYLDLTLPTGATVQWYSGATPPSTGTGVVNDWYVVNSGTTGLGDVYKKTGASTWTLQGNIRGAAGAGNVNTVNGVSGPDVVLTPNSLSYTVGTTQTYLDVFAGGNALTNTTNGTTYILTTNVPTDSGIMLNIEFDMALYTYGTIKGNLEVYMFNSAGGTIYQPRWTSRGDVSPTVQVAKNASNNLVLIFSGASSFWHYPRIRVSRVMSRGVNNTAYLTGWSGVFSTDTSALTNIASPASTMDFAASLLTTVDTSSTQTIGGKKTFSSGIFVTGYNSGNTLGMTAPGDIYMETGAVGRSLFLRPNGAGSSTGQMQVSTTQVTMTAALSVANVATIDGGGGVLNLKPGTLDHTYITFNARTATPGTRSGYIGYSSAGTPNMYIKNEISAGNFYVDTTGNGNIQLNTGTGIVTLIGATINASGTLQESGARVYSANNKPTDASSFTTGTFPDARLSTNVIMNSGNQTLGGVKTFSSTPVFSAGITVSNSQLISMSAGGVGLPALTTRNAGTKYVLYDTISATTTDYAMGVNTNTLWFSAGQAAGKFEWYVVDQKVASLSASGVLTASSFVGSGASLTGLDSSNTSLKNFLEGRVVGGHNYYADGGFENGIGSVVGANSATVAINTSIVHSGTNSVLVTLVTAGGDNGLSMPGLNGVLALNRTYIGTAWVYVPSATAPPAGVRLSAQGVGVASVVNGPYVTTTDRWVKTQMQFTTAASAGNVAFYVLSAGTTAGQTFYVDDVSVQEVYDAHVDIGSTQVIYGSKSFNTAITVDGGAGALNLKPGSADYTFMQLYARTATPGTRSGYFGFASAASTQLTISNEIAGGTVWIRTSGDTGDIDARGVLKEVGVRVYSPNNKPTDASSFTTGTLPDARLSTNVVMVTGAQTISGNKTFTGTTAGITAAMVGLGNVLNVAQEPTIAAGTVSQYYRGDKSWQTLDKTAVGLSNVTNVAQEPAIIAGTTSQFWRGDKTWQTLDKTAVGLSNVPNVDMTNLSNATSGTVATARLGSGTANNTTFLRGDQTWATISVDGGSA